MNETLWVSVVDKAWKIDLEVIGNDTQSLKLMEG
jgi:hypothetical protein